MGTLRATTVPVHRLTTEQRDAAWGVFSRFYENTHRERFDADLADKQHVFLLWADARLVGFSTVCVERVGEVVCIFSGDTVLEPEHHGVGALQWAFFRYILTTKLRHPHRMVTWFLISKGYKTYLLLARNFVRFWPRRDEPMPPWVCELLTTLAQRRFGDALDPDALVLRFDHHEHLRADVAPVDGQVDPDIRFFAEANPGHVQGDELCCLGVIDLQLMLAWPLKRLRRRTAR